MIHFLTMAAARQRLLRKVSPVGQAYFTTPGTFTWTCPEGVTEVSLALVGTGGQGKYSNTSSQRALGAGGNVRYINKVPVVPGQTYDITIPNKPSGQTSRDVSALGYTSSSPLSVTVKGGNGSPTKSTTSSSIRGGSVGFLDVGDYTGAGIDLKTFQAVAQDTAGPSTRGWPGAAFGGGGGLYQASSGGYSGAPGGGAVRIIWGDNRAFPDQNIGDL